MSTSAFGTVIIQLPVLLRSLDNKALNRSDARPTGQIVPRMVASPFYHPLHSQIHTLIVARLTRALSS